jgi:hypothetical protein
MIGRQFELVRSQISWEAYLGFVILLKELFVLDFSQGLQSLVRW